MGGFELGLEDVEGLEDRDELVSQGLQDLLALDLDIRVLWEVVNDQGGVSEEDQVGLGEIAISDIVVSLVLAVRWHKKGREVDGGESRNWAKRG